MNFTSKKITVCAIGATLAMILSMIENSIPITATVPGGKLGLSNAVMLLILVFYGRGWAFWVCILKSVLIGFMFAGPMSIIYSLPSALLSLLFMDALIWFFKDKISLIAASTVGAFVFNVAQVLIAAIVAQNIYILSYLPILSFIGICAGVATGFVSNITAIYLKSFFAQDKIQTK